MSKHFVVCQKRIFVSATRALFLTLDKKIWVFTPHCAYVLWSLWCQESYGTNFGTIWGIYRCWRQEKRILVDFIKMKREKASEYSVFSCDFHQKSQETFFSDELQHPKHAIDPSCKVSKHPFRLVLQADKKIIIIRCVYPKIFQKTW